MLHVNLIYNALALIGLPILAYYLYTFIIALLGFKNYEKYEKTLPKNRFAAVVAARNEAEVIGQLVDSLKATDYPEELLDIWVIPNNCDDNTGEVAQMHGANIYSPVGPIHSKGDALKEFFGYILNNHDLYDAFCVFDADNLVTSSFFNRMNDAIESGEKVAQGYRDAKNPKDSWISGSQSMFYWITNRFLNGSKRHYGLSAVLNGTGFMVTRDVIAENGFDTHTMTEDIEYSTQCILKGERIAFIREAVTYDEHPVTFNTSWKQRKRWSTGILQTFYSYSPKLFREFIKTKKFIYLDMILYLVAPYFQVIGAVYAVICALIYAVVSISTGILSPALEGLILANGLALLIVPLYTAFVVKFEKHKLSDCQPITYGAFWWFITSWIFINIEVFFNPIKTWEPIEHNHAVSLSELEIANSTD